jgi:hypothetical protein
VTCSIVDADSTLNKNELTITQKGKEGKRAKARMERGHRRALLLLVLQLLLHAHTFSEYRLLCLSLSVSLLILLSHTRSLFMSLFLFCMRVGDREGGRRTCVYPGTPDIIVSHISLSLSLCKTLYQDNIKRETDRQRQRRRYSENVCVVVVVVVVVVAVVPSCDLFQSLPLPSFPPVLFE